MTSRMLSTQHVNRRHEEKLHDLEKRLNAQRKRVRTKLHEDMQRLHEDLIQLSIRTPSTHIASDPDYNERQAIRSAHTGLRVSNGTVLLGLGRRANTDLSPERIRKKSSDVDNTPKRRTVSDVCNPPPFWSECSEPEKTEASQTVETNSWENRLHNADVSVVNGPVISSDEDKHQWRFVSASEKVESEPRRLGTVSQELESSSPHTGTALPSKTESVSEQTDLLSSNTGSLSKKVEPLSSKARPLSGKRASSFSKTRLMSSNTESVPNMAGSLSKETGSSSRKLESLSSKTESVPGKMRFVAENTGAKSELATPDAPRAMTRNPGPHLKPLPKKDIVLPDVHDSLRTAESHADINPFSPSAPSGGGRTGAKRANSDVDTHQDLPHLTRMGDLRHGAKMTHSDVNTHREWSSLTRVGGLGHGKTRFFAHVQPPALPVVEVRGNKVHVHYQESHGRPGHTKTFVPNTKTKTLLSRSNRISDFLAKLNQKKAERLNEASSDTEHLQEEEEEVDEGSDHEDRGGSSEKASERAQSSKTVPGKFVLKTLTTAKKTFRRGSSRGRPVTVPDNAISCALSGGDLKNFFSLWSSSRMPPLWTTSSYIRRKQQEDKKHSIRISSLPRPRVQATVLKAVSALESGGKKHAALQQNGSSGGGGGGEEGDDGGGVRGGGGGGGVKMAARLWMKSATSVHSGRPVIPV